MDNQDTVAIEYEGYFIHKLENFSGFIAIPREFPYKQPPFQHRLDSGESFGQALAEMKQTIDEHYKNETELQVNIDKKL